MNVRLALAAAIGALAASAPAQQPAVLADGTEVTVVAVPGAQDVALVALWPTGTRDDPAGASGLAAAITRFRLLALRAAWSQDVRLSCGSEVRIDHALVWLQVPVASLDAGGKCMAAALHPPADPATDDLAMVAIGQSALAADDAEVMIPGLRLQSLARARLLSGAAALPLAGRARELQNCSSLQLRAVAAQWPGARILALGGSDAAAIRSAVEVARPSAPASAPPPAWSPPVPPEPVDDVAGYSLLMLPIAVWATPLPAPDATDAAASALAVAILRERMSRRFLNPRRAVAESFAATPFVLGDWLAGDPVLVLSRRGGDWRPFGQARAELEAFLADVRSTPVDDVELELVRRLLLRGCRTVPGDGGDAGELAATPALLPARAITTAVVQFRALHARLAELSTVPRVEVQAALLRLLDPAGAWTGGLVPTQPPPLDVAPR